MRFYLVLKRGSRLAHDKIGQSDPVAYDLLFGNRPVAAGCKEGTSGNGGVRLDRTALDRAFQRVAKRGCDALPLETGVDVQTVEVAVAADVAKADDLSILLGNPGRVLQKRAVPGRNIDHPFRPRVALVDGVVPAVYRVHGIVKEGGEHRVIARYKWLDKSYIWQAERIRELVGRYNFRHIGVDVTGPGIGVFEQIRAFFPLATPINYSVQLKTQLVLKAKELIEAHRLKWDAGQNDIAHAFLTIRQGVTDSGQISYSASRTSATGHADVAWAIMHALAAEPIGKPKGGCVVFIQ